MVGLRVDLTRSILNGGRNATVYTNALGQVSGLVPANETLTMKIYFISSVCADQAIYTKQIGPFSSTTILPTIVLPTSSISNTLVQGTVTNCTNAPITNGYVWLQIAGQLLYSQVTNGAFSLNVINCSSAETSYTLQGFDLDAGKATLQQTGTLNNQTITLTNIQACTTIANPIGEFTDIDNNVYTYLSIGAQTWMQQNLNVSRYTDGTPIPQVTDPTTWAQLTTGAWCYYNNNSFTGTTYGKLYNYYAIAGINDNDPNTPNKVLAPTGWHIPSDVEWSILTDNLGGDAIAGGKMKEIGTTHWQPVNIGTNSSGFTGLPGGVCSSFGYFTMIGQQGVWWSTSAHDTPNLWTRYLTPASDEVGRGFNTKPSGLSVRCVRD
jgi:uncharacterized protein (TIGR02145 family)